MTAKLVSRKAECKECGSEIVWVRDGRKWRAVNPGTDRDHWDSCSAKKWQRVVETGEAFTDRKVTVNGQRLTVSGYDTPTGPKYSMMSAKAIRGENYVEVQCDCGVPPWEVCIHSFWEEIEHEMGVAL